MSKVAIKTDVLKKVLKSYGKDVSIKLGSGKSTTIAFNEQNKSLLEFLNEKIPLTLAQKVKISGFLFGGEQLADAKVNSINSFYTQLGFVNDLTTPTLEVNINSKWYPLLASITKWQGIAGNWVCQLNVYGNLGSVQYEKSILFGEWDFNDKAGNPTTKTINETLSRAGVRVASKEAVEHSKEMNKKIPEFWAQAGKVYDATGTGLVLGYFGWDEVTVGYKGAPSNVIIEPELENQYHRNELLESGSWQLPFVRVFSLKHKAYVFVDVEDLEDHVYHLDGKSKIVLPSNIMRALDSVFEAKNDSIFGDLFHGRHGGIVVLANGPSGVGKTLTAEVFAEHQQRPLYTMEMGEIGTSLKEVEMNLQRIFARAKKWNAVLLFDEAAIFLAERTSSDLERSAIVGIFLRLLDYYEGTFFLTTNRGGEIDKAFKSRVTLYLNYPDLTRETRHTIWQNMLKSANLDITVDPHVWLRIVETPLNGRQIRNQIRLLKLMYPDGNFNAQDILDSLQFTAV